MKLTLYSSDFGDTQVEITAGFQGTEFIVEKSSDMKMWDTGWLSRKERMFVYQEDVLALMKILNSKSQEELLQVIHSQFTGNCFDPIRNFFKTKGIKYYYEEG